MNWGKTLKLNWEKAVQLPLLALGNTLYGYIPTTTAGVMLF